MVSLLNSGNLAVCGHSWLLILIELDKLFSYEAEFECDQEKLTNYLVHIHYRLQKVKFH